MRDYRDEWRSDWVGFGFSLLCLLNNEFGFPFDGFINTKRCLIDFLTLILRASTTRDNSRHLRNRTSPKGRAQPQVLSCLTGFLFGLFHPVLKRVFTFWLKKCVSLLLGLKTSTEKWINGRFHAP